MRAKAGESHSTSALEKQFILIAAVTAALLSRLVFWLYTGRTWEDAMISLTPARNVWEGFGLTHHPSEPYVQSFTSALGEFILIAGELFHQGLFAMRLASLAGAVATIYYAFQIGCRLSFPRSAHVLVLGYLALDHLQIYFGMGGVETQVATAFLFANAYYFLTTQWRKLGFALGCALLCRPEFMLWGALVGLAILIWHRDAILKVCVPAGLIVLPWLVFSTWYYGTPVPHSLAVKAELAHAKSSVWAGLTHHVAVR